MGKGTDKLYITHSEWSSTDAFSASRSKSSTNIPGANFRRLPFNFCALSLQPFAHPVCTSTGTTFDLTHILPWLKKHGTNPVDGTPLKSADLIKLKFAKNDAGEYVDPVTFKPFTDNTHIVALGNTGNVFAWDTIERLNVKPKNWNDLVSEEPFTRKDIITLQDPEHLGNRDLSSFKYIQEGASTLTDEQLAERNDPASGINTAAMGSSAKILKAKEAVAKARAERTGASGSMGPPANGALVKKSTAASNIATKKAQPYNTALHTTGQAAASFTSTGLTPHTSADLALLTDEQFLLKPRRVKTTGHALLRTTHGTVTLTLNTEFAPRAVWNFLRLAKKGYYDGVAFHRNIRNFMLQGGDPTGTGRGGESCWGAGKPFADEYAASPLRHDGRGVLSMANKGKNTNTSQFFITYRAAKHLDLKHTIFGRVELDGEEGAENSATLARLENVKTGADDRPLEDCAIEEVVIVVDPFEEFMKNKAERERDEKEKEEIARQGGTEDDVTTWTGKRVRNIGRGDDAGGEGEVGVGKYMASSGNGAAAGEQVTEEWDMPEEPVAKKRKAGGFGNFDGW